jgi:hypothetical protein
VTGAATARPAGPATQAADSRKAAVLALSKLMGIPLDLGVFAVESGGAAWEATTRPEIRAGPGGGVRFEGPFTLTVQQGEVSEP